MRWQSRCADFTPGFQTRLWSRKIFGPPGKLRNIWIYTGRLRSDFERRGNPFISRRVAASIFEKNTFPFGWSLRDNWKEPLGGSYFIVYYREYPPPPTKLGVINFAGTPVYSACVQCTQSLEFYCVTEIWEMTRRSEIWTSLKCVCSSWNQVPCINSYMEAEICLQPPRIYYGVYESLHV